MKRKIVDMTFVIEMTDNDNELIESMISIFRQTHGEYSKTLNSLLRRKDWDELARIAHKAMATTSAFGMYDLSNALKNLEDLAKNSKKTELCKKIIDKFEDDCNRAEDELNDYLTKKRMNMIQTTQMNDVLIITFEGIDKLNVVITHEVKKELAKIEFKPETKYLLDLTSVQYIDSTGFGVLLSILRSCKNSNSSLKLCNINSKVMELLKLLQLQNVFDLHENRAEALEAFK